MPKPSKAQKRKNKLKNRQRAESLSKQSLVDKVSSQLEKLCSSILHEYVDDSAGPDITGRKIVWWMGMIAWNIAATGRSEITDSSFNGSKLGDEERKMVRREVSTLVKRMCVLFPSVDATIRSVTVVMTNGIPSVKVKLSEISPRTIATSPCPDGQEIPESRFPYPDKWLIERYLQRFRKSNLCRQEAELVNIFRSKPYNTDPDDVLLKVTALNVFLGRDDRNTDKIVSYILSDKHFDKKLKQISNSVVDKLAKEICAYEPDNEFARCYCSYHYPELYLSGFPYIEVALIMYERTYSYMQRQRRYSPRRYFGLVKLFNSFLAAYRLEDCPIGDIQHFLYQVALEDAEKHHRTANKRVSWYTDNDVLMREIKNADR